MKKNYALSQRQKRIISLIIIGIFVLLSLILFVYIGKPLVEFAKEPEKFRRWIKSFGVFSSIVYMLIVLLQVVIAIIPGEPLEIVGGYAFGFFEGTILCLIAGTIGSLIVFLLVKKFGMRFVCLFFSKEKIDKIKFLRYSPKRDIIFMILFIIPGTPKDMLCYFAGITDMKISVWLFICSLGRIPSVITSTIGGDALGTKDYLYAIIAFGVTILISLSGLIIYNRICTKNNKNDKEV